MISFKLLVFLVLLNGLIGIARCQEGPVEIVEAPDEPAEEKKEKADKPSPAADGDKADGDKADGDKAGGDEDGETEGGPGEIKDGDQTKLKYTALLVITATGDEPTPALCNGVVLSTKAILTSSWHFFKGEEAKKVTELFVYAGMTSTKDAATWKDKCPPEAGTGCQARPWDESKGVIIDSEEPAGRKKNERLALIFLKAGFDLTDNIGTIGLASGDQFPPSMYDCTFSAYTAEDKLQAYRPTVAKDFAECAADSADDATMSDRICTEEAKGADDKTKVGPCTRDIGGPLQCSDVVAGVFIGTKAAANRVEDSPKACSGAGEGNKMTYVYLFSGPYESWIVGQMEANGNEGMRSSVEMRDARQDTTPPPAATAAPAGGGDATTAAAASKSHAVNHEAAPWFTLALAAVAVVTAFC